MTYPGGPPLQNRGYQGDYPPDDEAGPQFTAVCALEDLQDRGMREFKVDGKEVLLARLGEQVFAVSNRCTHLKACLSEGKLDGQVLTCPRHGSRFDVTTGGVVEWSPEVYGAIPRVMQIFRRPRGLACYELKVEDGRVLVRV